MPIRLRYVHRSREGCNRQVVSTGSIFGPRTVCCQLICRFTNSKAFLERGEIAMEMEPEDGLLFIRNVDDDINVTAPLLASNASRRSSRSIRRIEKPLTRVALLRYSPHDYPSAG
jgi:hypothetical protein